MKQSKVEEKKLQESEGKEVKEVKTEKPAKTEIKPEEGKKEEAKPEQSSADSQEAPKPEQDSAEGKEESKPEQDSAEVREESKPEQTEADPAEATQEYVSERQRRKSKFFLLLVTEKEDGVIRQHHIGSAMIEAVGIVLFALVVLVICKLVYDGITIRNNHEQMVSQISQINTLTDENESLTVENATLTSKITVLSETVSKKVATEDAITQEESENAMPKGFPLSGTATMEETTGSNDQPVLEFTAAEGVNIVSTGTGTVLSVDVDEQYGNKIVIDHGNGYQSVYRNAGTPLVKTGEELGKGYILFTVGEENTKLGYEIIQNEENVDPMILIEING